MNLEAARWLWCFPFRLNLQLYMAGSEQQAMQCPHEVATALLHQFTPPDSFHCISQARKDLRFIKKYEYFRSLVYSLQAGVLVGTRGTLAQSQQLSGKPWLFTIWGELLQLTLLPPHTTTIFVNLGLFRHFETITNIKNSYQDGLGRTTQTLDHILIVVVHIFNLRQEKVSN